MGEVFRARDTRLNRGVAVKMLPKDFVADADRLRRFEQEAKTLAALNHPNVLTIHDAGVHGGAPYLVSELLEGAARRDEWPGVDGAQGHGVCVANCARPGCGARQRSHSPRSEAGKYFRHQGRAGEDSGFRT